MTIACTSTMASAASAHPEALDEDEEQRGHRLGRQEGRLDEGIADEAADRLDLVLDHAGGLRRLDRRDVLRPEAQEQGEQIEAHAPQHALAENAPCGC